MVIEPITHIQRDDRGIAWVVGTNTKVIEIALDQVAYGWDAEEIHAAHPHLSRAQIHAALSFYYDHQSELDAQIQEGREEFRQLKSHAGGQLTRAELLQRLKAR